MLTAGILPNPQLTYSYDWVTGGRTVGTVNPYGLGVNWDVTSLISHDAKVKAAGATVAAINLDVAWQEWQIAEAAKSAAYDLLALQSELAAARETDARLQENLALIRKAAELHAKTSVDLAAAESAAQESNAAILQMTRDLERQRLALNRAIGLAPETSVRLRTGLALPAHFQPPSERELVEGIEQRRLDLLGLQRGYESQEQTLRAAVLDQFPKINLGFDKAKDNTNVRTVGVGVSVDIPIFDRNQGVIATEKATRQKLFDEYVSRSFDARADIAAALVDIHSINDQIAARPGGDDVALHTQNAVVTRVSAGLSITATLTYWVTTRPRTIWPKTIWMCIKLKAGQQLAGRIELHLRSRRGGIFRIQSSLTPRLQCPITS